MIRANVKKEAKQLRLGVVGCSAISQAAHLRAASSARNVELAAICDSSKDLRWKMAAIYEPKKVYSTYQELLEDPDIDAVIIGVPERFHADSALQAVLAGKHVLVEQPMGLTIEECETLLEIGHRKHQIVQVSSVRRFDPGISYAHAFVQENIGKPVSYQGWLCESNDSEKIIRNLQPILYTSGSPVRNAFDQSGHQFLFLRAVDAFDTAIYLLGPIHDISARESSCDDMQAWSIVCTFENGVLGTLNLNHNIRGDRQEGFRVFGTDGSVCARCHNPWQFRTTELTCWNTHSGEISAPYEPDAQVYRRQLESFADVVLSDKHTQQTGAGLKAGIHVLRAILATVESAAQGGKTVVLNDVKNRTSI